MATRATRSVPRSVAIIFTKRARGRPSIGSTPPRRGCARGSTAACTLGAVTAFSSSPAVQPSGISLDGNHGGQLQDDPAASNRHKEYRCSTSSPARTCCLLASAQGASASSLCRGAYAPQLVASRKLQLLSTCAPPCNPATMFCDYRPSAPRADKKPSWPRCVMPPAIEPDARRALSPSVCAAGSESAGRHSFASDATRTGASLLR